MHAAIEQMLEFVTARTNQKKKEEGLFQMKTDMTFLIRSHFPKCVYIYEPASFSLPIPIDGFRVPEPMHPSMGQY